MTPRKRPTLRRRVYAQIEPAARRRGLSLINKVVVAAILLSVLAAVVGTEPLIVRGRETLFEDLERVFAGLFAIEYGLRLWTVVERPGHHHPVWGRLRWVISPIALIDLAAWAPSLLLPGLAPTYILRVFRLARSLRLAKLGRFSHAWRLVGEAVYARRFELLLTLGAALFALLLSATAMYLAEGQSQPEKFGSIPRALWWATVTLTTIGYGDVYPVTPLGKLLAGLTAVVGIGLIAAPTGILAAAFSEAFQRQRRRTGGDLPKKA
jgi:voltage-gated potassium channel